MVLSCDPMDRSFKITLDTCENDKTVKINHHYHERPEGLLAVAVGAPSEPSGPGFDAQLLHRIMDQVIIVVGIIIIITINDQ